MTHRNSIRVPNAVGTNGESSGWYPNAYGMENEGANSRMIRCLNGKTRNIFPQMKNVPENRRAIIIIFGAIFHETESIHITDVRFALGPQQIKATDGLLEHRRPRATASGDRLL